MFLLLHLTNTYTNTNTIGDSIMNVKYIAAFSFFALFFSFFILKGLSTYPEKSQKIFDTRTSEKSEMSDLYTIYDSVMMAEMDSTGVVGASVAIVYNNKIDFLKCYGVKKTGELDSINPQTVFRLASVSKTVTGVLAGMLDNEGLISLNDRVVDCIPDFKLKLPENTNNVRIKNILSHSSGLEPHAYDNLVELNMPLGKLMYNLRKANISGKPGQLYSYQNVAYSLFDTIAALKTSMSYSDVMSEKLFKPFEMYNASTDFASFRSNNNIAYPHQRSKEGYKLLPLNKGYYNTISAAGINASISDMAHFMLKLLRTDSLSLDSSIKQTIFTPQIATPLNRHYFKQWGHVNSKKYAIGWRIINYKGHSIAYHGGFIEGYRAEIALCQELNIGIVFLTNSPNKAASVSIPTFLNMLFDYKQESEYMAKK